MIKRLLPLVVALILIPSMVSAVTMDVNCTSGVYTELIYNGSSVIFNNTFTCPSGCADNGLECDYPASPEYFFAFAIVFSLAAFTFAYIGLKLDEEYKPLQFMFLAFAVAYVAFVSYIVSGFTLLSLNSLNSIMVQGYILGIFTILGLVFYFIYLLVVYLLGLFKFKRSSGRPFKW